MTALIIGAVAVALVVFVFAGRAWFGGVRKRHHAYIAGLGFAIEADKPLVARGTYGGLSSVIKDFRPRFSTGDGTVISLATRIRFDCPETLPETILTSRDYDSLDRATAAMRTASIEDGDLLGRFELEVADERGERLWQQAVGVPAIRSFLDETGAGMLHQLTIFKGQLTLVIREQAIMENAQLKTALDAGVAIVKTGQTIP